METWNFTKPLKIVSKTWNIRDKFNKRYVKHFTKKYKLSLTEINGERHHTYGLKDSRLRY